MTKNHQFQAKRIKKIMNLNTFIFHCSIFLFIFNASTVYTKVSQDDNNKSVSITTSHTTDKESDTSFDQINSNNPLDDQLTDQNYLETWKLIEEIFHNITEQTQTIQYCLQQIELILNSGKIQFHEQSLSKSQLLYNIKNIKEIIEELTNIYTKDMSQDRGIETGTIFNAAILMYLLPVIQKNVKLLNAHDFDQAITENFELLIKDLTTAEQMNALIEKNNRDIEYLKIACEDIGLSYFNKLYRFLDTQTLPIYGKSTLATINDLAFWTTLGVAAYTIPLYICNRDTEIPFLQKWNLTTVDETSHQQRPYIVNDLYGKKFVGDFNETREIYNPTGATSKKDILNQFGLYSHVHAATLSYSDQFIISAIGLVSWFAKKPLTEMFHATQHNVMSLFRKYVKGDFSLDKQSHEVPKTYFKDMIGGKDLEKLARELADYLKHPTRYERANITPATGYLLVGPSQTGKSFFAKALKTLIDEAFEGSNEKVKFANITADDVEYFGGFANLFFWARKQAPIILFIDELDMYGARRDKNSKYTQELLTSLNGVETDLSKKIIVIAATNKPEELDFALKQKGRLGNIITFELPPYECRKEYLMKQLVKKNINLADEMIETIAQETHDQTYNMIDDIIRQALQLATFQTRPVNQADFEIVLDREIRKIKTNTTMSPQERELVAIYQAGQAAARHLLKTNQQVVKITIDTVDKPLKSKEGFGIISEQKGESHENHELLDQNHHKPTRLGFVFTMSPTNNYELLSDIEQEQELLALLAGQAALELIKQATFHEFGKEDRAKVIDMLERKIAQGTPLNHHIRQQALAQKEILYKKIKTILQPHVSFIKLITDTLLKNRNINQREWLALTAHYPALS